MSGFTIEIDTSEVERDWAEACRVLSDGARSGVAKGVEEGAQAARSSHPYKDRSGALTGSIRGYAETSTEGGAVGVLEATAKHASYIEKGTDAHEIRARKAGALHWPDGPFVKAVHHPGTKPMPFLQPIAEKVERIVERELEAATDKAAAIMAR